MSKAWMALVIPAVLAGTVFGVAGTKSPAMKCEIRFTQERHGLQVLALVDGKAGETGSYTLDLRKSGPAGMSDVSQGGDFTFPAKGEALVSETELDIARHDVDRVRLSVSGSKDGTQCDRTFRAR